MLGRIDVEFPGQAIPKHLVTDQGLKYRVQYSTVQYSTVQYSTVQYSTVQYSTVQYSTVQYRATVQYRYSDSLQY